MPQQPAGHGTGNGVLGVLPEDRLGALYLDTGAALDLAVQEGDAEAADVETARTVAPELVGHFVSRFSSYRCSDDAFTNRAAATPTNIPRPASIQGRRRTNLSTSRINSSPLFCSR